MKKVIEVLKKLMEEDFNSDNIELFKESMCKSLDDFRLGVVFVDQFHRTSDEYKRITEYHMTLIKSKDTKYAECFDSIQKMAEKENAMQFFDDKILGEEILEELKQNESTIQYTDGARWGSNK